ncbi:MAG: GntG family PLP-dependent aldolase [Gemmatimonadota bacterium]|jgi:threonine aldolase
MSGPAPVDLRSDTVTRPTPAMRRVIADAVVGDDALGDDPTVRALEERIATVLGKEAAVLFPTGTMANETALAILAAHGTEAIVEATAHFFDWEMGAPAVLCGVQLRPVAAPGGMLTPELVEDAIRPGALLQIGTAVVCVENTHNASGGRVLPLETLRAIRAVVDRHGLALHLDGARLWNAAVASATSEAEFAAAADTVMVALSKGLGCPVGSMLAGNADAMRKARAVRRRFGGAMRQAGILAAAGLYALDHNRERLADDHRRAATLGTAIAGLPGIDVVPPETNMVMIDLRRPDLDAGNFLQRLAEHGVLLSPFTRTRVRAVTHLDIGDDDITRAADAFAAVLGPPAA